ncbi:MAG: glycoside hydrolase N-terminal domain-containing protein, partial [Armatimonadetes bacterium]|nr:glycoside hydrolase N-terminal domain-containing protein [Armatimonadota bacterium]
MPRPTPLADATVLAALLVAGAARAEGLTFSETSAVYEAGPAKALDLTDEVTLEAWVQADPMPTRGGRILDKTMPGTQDAYLLDTWPGNSLRMITSKGHLRFDARLPADRWTHVAGVYSASRRVWRLYLDGKLVAEQTDGEFPPLTVNGAPLCVGADPTGGNRFLGRIRRAAVYARALSPEEIARRAADPAPLPGVLGEWVLEGQPGQRIVPAAGALALVRAGGEVELLGQAPPPDNPLTLWFREPAKSFIESCPVGNGRLGGMLFGGVERERIVLNEQTMWSGSVQDADRPEAWQALPEIRQLLFQGRNREAQELLSRSFVCQGPGSSQGAAEEGPFGCYQTLGDLRLDFGPIDEEVRDYRRELDLDAATARVSFVRGGVRQTRELFASAPDHVLVYHLAAEQPGRLSFTASLRRQKRVQYAFDGGDGLVMSGQLSDGKPDGKGVRYLARLRVVAPGDTVERAERSEDGLVVSGAREVTLYLTAGTDLYDPAFETTTAKQLAAAVKKPLTAIRSAHLQEFRSFFRRCTLDLGGGEAAQRPTPERVKAVETQPDPQLAALCFQYGRYLLINSSRPDSPLPANLQGIWAEEYQTPWNGDFHLDINVQMNYWPAEPTGLGDCTLPLLRFIGSLVPNGQKTARAYYNSPGWVAHVVSNPWHFTSPGEHASWGSTVSGAGWLCEHLWEHYAFHPDRKYLEWVYPILRGSAEFFLDYLVEEPRHHWLVTAPSNSPENAFRLPNGDVANTCLGPTIYEQIVRELFANTIAAARVLGRDGAFASRLEDARERLAPMQVGRYGQLQEWLEAYEEGEPHHRHTSHLYGLYPSDQITPATPDLFQAARVTLERRGDASTGWSMAWKSSFWARLR